MVKINPTPQNRVCITAEKAFPRLKNGYLSRFSISTGINNIPGAAMNILEKQT